MFKLILSLFAITLIRTAGVYASEIDLSQTRKNKPVAAISPTASVNTTEELLKSPHAPFQSVQKKAIRFFCIDQKGNRHEEGDYSVNDCSYVGIDKNKK